jgi:hypothetical protein
MLKQDQLNVPISVHVEYLPQGSAQENLRAIGRDYKRLQEMLGIANE